MEMPYWVIPAMLGFLVGHLMGTIGNMEITVIRMNKDDLEDDE